MNTSALLASSFFLALFAFTGAEFIYDSDGDIVSNGGKYYLLPRREGGGAIKGATINKPKSRSCYLAVVAEPLNENGWAVKIGTPYRLFHISDDHPLNVSFARLPSNACTHSPSWIVASVTGLDTDPVMVGKPEEFSVPRSGYFYIKKYESTQFYSFVFCYSTSSCGYVALKLDKYSNYRLVVTQDRSVRPVIFKLVKATSEDVESGGISMVV